MGIRGIVGGIIVPTGKVRAILTLESFLERYPIFDVEPEHSWEMRRMVVDNYLVCYVVDTGKVTVTDILFGASNVHVRLQERRP